MALRFEFDPQKALEAILYVSSRAGTDKYGTLKVLYVADKLHLQKYGRFIAGDYYHALENGPTPMLSYDIIQCAAGMKPKCPAAGVREALRVGTEDNPHALMPQRKPDLSAFSESDIECMEEVIARLEGIDPAEKFRELWNDVHDLAWKQARENKQNGLMDIEEIARQFPDGEELIEYLKQA